jgi:hypothetical protein
MASERSEAVEKFVETDRLALVHFVSGRILLSARIFLTTGIAQRAHLNGSMVAGSPGRIRMIVSGC